MGTWGYMFFFNILIPIITIFVGWMVLKHPPKKINSIYGYRTTMSMKNMDTWRFAHEYCGNIWWKMGWLMLLISIIVQGPFFKSNEDTIEIVGSVICIIQCVILVISVIPVERALRRTFNKDGSRK